MSNTWCTYSKWEWKEILITWIHPKNTEKCKSKWDILSNTWCTYSKWEWKDSLTTWIHPKKTQNCQRKFQLSILCKYSHDNKIIGRNLSQDEKLWKIASNFYCDLEKLIWFLFFFFEEWKINFAISRFIWCERKSYSLEWKERLIH